MKKEKKKYSYIRYPYSRNGWYSLGTGLASLVMGIAVAVMAVVRQGGVTLFLAAVGLSSILFGIVSLFFCLAAMREKERNHLPAGIGGIFAVLAALLWVWILWKRI